MRATPRIVWLGLLCCGVPGVSAGPLTIATEGRAALPIVLAADGSEAERTAALELSDYLQRISGAEFELVLEADVEQAPFGIQVGPTAAAGQAGLVPESMGPEEWVIRSTDRGLLLVGGRPRGTLYAVYRFLEDQLGVRWWTPFDESVPRADRVAIPPLERRGRPVFAYRDVHGLRGPREFGARNRMNGHYSKLGPAYGGSMSYGPPSQVHTAYLYVPPDRYFEAHSEYFSEKVGLRYVERGQLCLTQPDLVGLVTSAMQVHIDRARDEAESNGTAAPELFNFSNNDWGGRCRCNVCSRLAEAQGGHGGVLLAFVNQVADRIAKSHPEVLIDTLAYSHSFDPPRDLEARPNVVVRLSALYQRDFSKPLSHPQNERYMSAVNGWSRRTRHLRIWDYSVTFGDDGDLPLPNLSFMAQDYRFYAAEGVEGLFVQHDHPISSDLRDLKLWVMLKLLEDPARSLPTLIRDFTDGYYGAAGKHVRRYLRVLERAARRRPASIRFHSTAPDFSYVDLGFSRTAHRLFDQAERQVAADPVRSRRVRHARLSLDRATLLRFGELTAEAGGSDAGLDPAAIAARYRQTWQEQIERRVPAPERGAARRELDEEMRRFLDAEE